MQHGGKELEPGGADKICAAVIELSQIKVKPYSKKWLSAWAL
jgi:hypothetical protein